MRSGVLVDRLVGTRCEARLIVDLNDRYGELLRSAGVISAIGRAAIVLGKHGNGSGAEGVGCPFPSPWGLARHAPRRFKRRSMLATGYHVLCSVPSPPRDSPNARLIRTVILASSQR
jgi:hypothetical protein